MTSISGRYSICDKNLGLLQELVSTFSVFLWFSKICIRVTIQTGDMNESHDVGGSPHKFKADDLNSEMRDRFSAVNLLDIKDAHCFWKRFRNAWGMSSYPMQWSGRYQCFCYAAKSIWCEAESGIQKSSQYTYELWDGNQKLSNSQQSCFKVWILKCSTAEMWCISV